ncbi:sensor histidine kinase [Neptuniibacter sp.]|uniref:sensor histidine kinase n=1 Tax=Neptuniibacter sp. TaxID=1962643 RepID=UPI00260CDD3F|nr:sensor histidine kinase [Neptuniibacter sp.]MCP4595289.1 HAMP domain-containing protein [Neptuniibacter sp.]
MSRRLFWKLNFSFLAVSLIVFSSLHYVSSVLTVSMTEISNDNQQLLLSYAERAEALHNQGDSAAIVALTQEVRDELDVWSAVVSPDNRIISGKALPGHLNLGFQRYVYWPIHHFMKDVVIGLDFTESNASFVIELPSFMYPNVNTALIHNLLTIVIPSLMLMLFCWIVYRYLMRPLEALNKGTVKLSEGDLSARVLPEISANRKDELTQVAASFDSMADRIERLVTSQRQLLGDLSHELRTPLTRIGLAIDICKQDGEDTKNFLPRLEREVGQMHGLVEDALTLAWLESEPVLEQEGDFNLATLLNLISEDAEFEYPGRSIHRDYPADLYLSGSSQQVLSQCIENVLRNALKYAPADESVEISCLIQQESYLLIISDRGTGVPEDCLEKIFEPFYRTDKARSREQGGFGLGLALCKRQMTAIGGKIWAEVNNNGGLSIKFLIPK